MGTDAFLILGGCDLWSRVLTVVLIVCRGTRPCQVDPYHVRRDHSSSQPSYGRPYPRHGYVPFSPLLSPILTLCLQTSEHSLPSSGDSRSVRS